MKNLIKLSLVSAVFGLTFGSLVGVASAQPRSPKGPKVPKSALAFTPDYPVRAWHVVFKADSVRATPRAMTREPGQTCTRRALAQGSGSVTICESPARAAR